METKRVFQLTNVIAPTGEEMDLQSAPHEVCTMILDILNRQNEIEAYTLSGFVIDQDGRTWQWQY